MFVGGPVVVLTAQQCAVVDVLLGFAARELARRDCLPPAPDVLGVLEEIRRASAHFRAEQQLLAVRGSPGSLLDAEGGTCQRYLTTAGAALRLGIGERQVRHLLAAGRLAGERPGALGAWRVEAASVAELQRRRVQEGRW